ncbi:hypothetical protein M8C21_029720 [Ambrosia artemisiifolia]|uniref:Uncharacterized protein n=1 Tax=Ambrosia artemisiifolia TaxID=4212 RepID=A0AAD5GCE0_AMBAR|nr:hypothetical protein M8C21_029720 [Ambrosia artemisiifolia]
MSSRTLTVRSLFHNPNKNRRLGMQLKDVLNLLDESKEPLTADQIIERVDLEGDKAVFFETLLTSPMVHFDGRFYSFKFPSFVWDKSDLGPAAVMEEEIPIKGEDDRQNSGGTSKRALAPISNKRKRRSSEGQTSLVGGIRYTLQNVPQAT